MRGGVMTVLEQVARHTGARLLAGHEPSTWLRGRLVDLVTRWRAGQSLGCAHLPGAEAWLVALWDPARVACPACVPLVLASGEEDRTCDRCRIVHLDVRPLLVEALPGVLVTFGLCPSCFGREVP